jgi:hypothetical protein
MSDPVSKSSAGDPSRHPMAQEQNPVSQTTIKAKLKRGTFAATLLVATLAALEMEGIDLSKL